MKVLITGGKGFIGSHLVRKVVSDGHQVFVISKSKEIPVNLKGVGFDTIIGTYSDVDLLNDILPNIDVVIHLAWSSVPRLDLKEIETDITNNVNGSIKLLNACVLHKIKKFVNFNYSLVQITLQIQSVKK